MRVLVTGVSGYVGAALAPRMRAAGHEVRGFARDRARVTAELDDLAVGDVLTGAGLDEALHGVEVAYYLVHSMEAASDGAFDAAERRSAEQFADAADRAGVRRIVYLGGLVPSDVAPSRHLGSRLAVEETLLGGRVEAVAFRASIVLAARSRSFRFLVRLIERLPVMAVPGWGTHRTQPVDGRDMIAFLQSAATAPGDVTGRSWDIGGRDVVSYADLLARIAHHMMIDRPTFDLGFSMTPVASVVAAAVAGEDPALIGPLMESLEHDLLLRDDMAAGAFGVRLHTLDSAIERSLRDLEAIEEVRAR